MNKPLQQVTYFSKAVKLMDNADLMLLLKECRELNAKNGVTGMLLYIKSQIYGGLQGRFIQIIERPEEVIADIYDRINADNRHQNVTLLMERKTYFRDFPDWTIGFENQETDEFTDEIKTKLTMNYLEPKPDKSILHLSIPKTSMRFA